jgi:hypothetical protein
MDQPTNVRELPSVRTRLERADYDYLAQLARAERRTIGSQAAILLREVIRRHRDAFTIGGNDNATDDE